jgi:hypothetical protein
MIIRSKAIVLVFLSFFVTGHSTGGTSVYTNDFKSPIGTAFPEWTSSKITWINALDKSKSGALPPPPVTNSISPNKARVFLGEFGGPPIGRGGDADYNHHRVDQTITLTLTNLTPHRELKVSFTLLILKSWDGNSPAYGPDQWRLRVDNGSYLLDTTFSNNPKVQTEGSLQDYPTRSSQPRTGAIATNVLGYGSFFGDSSYRMEFAVNHSAASAKIHFGSSLFEGKGTGDESWGLADVVVETAEP